MSQNYLPIRSIIMNSFLTIGGGWFAGIATLVTAFAAYWIYKKQKIDKKISLARLILNEVRAAEESVERLAKFGVGENPEYFGPNFPTNTWMKGGHFFADDFSQDETRQIFDFYGQCILVKDALDKIQVLKDIAYQGKAEAFQRKLVDLAESKDVDTEYVKSRDKVYKRINDENHWFMASWATNQLQNELKAFHKISITPCGSKLLEMSSGEYWILRRRIWRRLKLS